MTVQYASEQDYEKNVEILSHILPELALKLPQCDVSGTVFCTTRNGMLNLQKRGAKSTFLHSNYDPQKEAKEWFASLKLDDINVLYVFGVGLGYYYEVAKPWLDGDFSRYIVFLENDMAAIKRLFETDMGRKILEDRQVQLHYFAEYEKAGPMLDWLTWYFVLLHVDVSALKSYEIEQADLFLKMRSRIMQDSLNKDAHSGESMRHSKVFYRNYYSNMQLLPQAYHGCALFGQFPNTPAIICGAGPSLNKNFDTLKTLGDRALILAGGSSVNSLTKRGFMPHFGGGIDPNPTQQSRLQTNYAYEVPYFYRNRMYNAALTSIHGPHLYVNGCGGYPIAEWFEEKLGIKAPILDEGHNIINLLIEIAVALGCNPIIFVGMDLAYTDMRSYASDIVQDSQVTQEGITKTNDTDSSAFLRRDINGNLVYTLWKWTSESEWISKYAKGHPGHTFINATEGGIGFEGIVNMPLEKVQEQYLQRQYDLQSQIHSHIQRATMSVSYENVLSVLTQLKESLVRCISQATQMLEEADRVEKKIKKGKNIPENLQSGKLALLEVDMQEELAFEQILLHLSQAITVTLQREMHEINAHKNKMSETEHKLRQLALNKKKVLFIKDSAEVNLIQLQSAVDQFKAKGYLAEAFYA